MRCARTRSQTKNLQYPKTNDEERSAGDPPRDGGRRQRGAWCGVTGTHLVHHPGACRVRAGLQCRVAAGVPSAGSCQNVFNLGDARAGLDTMIWRTRCRLKPVCSYTLIGPLSLPPCFSVFSAFDGLSLLPTSPFCPRVYPHHLPSAAHQNTPVFSHPAGQKRWIREGEEA